MSDLQWIGWVPYKEPPAHWTYHPGTIDWLVDNPQAHSTKLHYGKQGEYAVCGVLIPESDDVDRAVMFTSPRDGIKKCKRCLRSIDKEGVQR